MISGARSGQMTWLRRLVARAQGQSLTAFVVPGGEVARAHGLDFAAAGLNVVASPRHAAVLVLVGEIPPGLVHPTAVVYAQMPRPRAILAIGANAPAHLPMPDIAVALTQADLVAGVQALGRQFATGAWAEDTAPFTVEADADMDNGEMHHDTHSGMQMDHGMLHEDPKPSDDQEPHEQHANHAPHNPNGNDHAGHHAMASDKPPENMDHGDSQPVAPGNISGDAEPDSAHAMEHGDHGMHDLAMGGMDMGDMDMDMSGGFMSMIAMTKDVPRSPDGLPMEWFDAPFGPLFAGLPGGLALTFTLDGDTVARAQVNAEIMTRHLDATWMGSVTSFPDRLARLDPLTPVAYRLLAWRAIESAAGIRVDTKTAHARIAALEHERALSHLNWLTGFASLLGADGIAQESARLRTALTHAHEETAIRRVAAGASAFARRVERVPLLRQRLKGIGVLSTPEAENARGPIARASEHMTDTRTDDPHAQSLGFAPIVIGEGGGDALARLHVRLRETVQSLTLWEAARTYVMSAPYVPSDLSGMGNGTVETPRGAATLHVRIEDGTVRYVHLDLPSIAHAKLVESVTLQYEVADALIGVASLDLSPWEIGQ